MVNAKVNDIASANENVGELIRNRRIRISMSVRSLAKLSGFSASFISQVENGQASPSIASLQKIASALGVTLGGFFAPETEAIADMPNIVRFGGGSRLTSEWSMATVRALGAAGILESLLVSLAPGGRSGNALAEQSVETFGFVFVGPVVLHTESESHTLGSGDAVTIPANTPLRWENISDKDVHLVLVATGGIKA